MLTSPSGRFTPRKVMITDRPFIVFEKCSIDIIGPFGPGGHIVATYCQYKMI